MKSILDENCLECHSQDKRKGGLSLATYGDLLEGGKDGAIVRPGSSARSMIIDRLTGAVEPQMPKDEAPLDPGQIGVIRRWIEQGARATPASPAAPQPWEAPLALAAPRMPATVWARWQAPLDRFVASYLAGREGRGAGDRLRRAIRATRVSRRVGPAADRLRNCRLSYRIALRESASVSSGRCSTTTGNTLTTGSRSGTICCGTRTA